ncbi:MAG: hypothetical protein GTO17_13340 [Candidatus Aminicenantes bacterium]|nr:hypothetical protein [Candidatus Aminicenantes bacterium]
MAKKVFVLGTILLWTSLAFSAGPDPLITITAPPNGTTLNMCTTYTIQWTHSAYFESVPQTCTIYCGNDIISPPIPVTADSFVWTVGMKQNGTILLPDQSYEITIESDDYDVLGGPVITIASGANINITAPSTGQIFLRGVSTTIQWTHSVYFNCVPQNCTLFCGMDIISPPVPVTGNSFVWTVGRKHDGTYLAPGIYEITLESPDYDELSGPMITIIALELIIRPYPKKVRIIKILDCPMCYRLDPRQFVLKMSGLDFVSLEVVRGRRVLARFPRFAPNRLPPTPAKINLNEEDVRLIKQGRPAFTVLVKSAKGQTLLKKAVQLEVGGRAR